MTAREKWIKKTVTIEKYIRDSYITDVITELITSIALDNEIMYVTLADNHNLTDLLKEDKNSKMRLRNAIMGYKNIKWVKLNYQYGFDNYDYLEYQIPLANIIDWLDFIKEIENLENGFFKL